MEFKDIIGVAGGFAAILAFICLFPPLPSLPQRTWQRILRCCRKFPTCEHLTWDDLPEDPDLALHQCQGYTPNGATCQHVCPHNPGNGRCWESNLPLLFNIAWNSSRRRDSPIEKPIELSGSQEYLQTDSRIMLSFLLSTAPVDQGYPGWWLQLDRREDDITVYHLAKGINLDQSFRSLSRHEADSIISGYPPWYKKKFQSVYGYEVSHPMRDLNDLRRGGWVIAVGFQASPDGRSENYKPTPFYLYPKDWTPSIKDVEVLGRLGMTSLGGGVLRVIRVMENVIKPAFLSEPDKSDIEQTLGKIKDMNSFQTHSGARLYIPGVYMPNWFGKVSEQGAGLLTREDVEFAMSLFNREPLPLEDPERARLRPILRPLLIAAFNGVREVFEYDNNINKSRGAAAVLRSKEVKIWLRVCNVRNNCN